MSMREPEVLSGAREPAAQRAARVSARSAELYPGGSKESAREQAALARSDKTVFKFVAKGYRLQLTANAPDYLPGGRMAKVAKDIVIQATEGLAVLDNHKDKEALRLMLGDKEDALNYPPHPSYKRDFWLLAEEVATNKAKANDEAISTLLNNTDALSSASPEIRRRVLAALKASGQDDFDLEATQPEAKPAKGKAARAEA